jgi:uncharacterized protein (TIGR03382 family)
VLLVAALLPLAGRATSLPSAVAAGTYAPVTQPRLRYYGGRVIGATRLVPVHWGARAPAFARGIEDFYADFLTGPTMDVLAQYGTSIPSESGDAGTGQRILRGTVLPGVVLPGTPDGGFITETALVAGLQAAISAGALPFPDPDVVYAVHLAPGTLLSDGSATMCTTYCAFHDTFRLDGGAPVVFSALPGVGPDAGCACDLLSSASHELAEMITNPDVGLTPTSRSAWWDPAPVDALSDHQEIGDVCERGPNQVGSIAASDGGRWPVQREWSNAAGACLVDPAAAFQLTLGTPVDGGTAGSWVVTIATTALDAGTGTARLSLAQLPTGVTASFDRTNVPLGESATLQLTAPETQAWSFTLGVRAESGQALALAVVTVSRGSTVVPPSPAPPTVHTGAGGCSTTGAGAAWPAALVAGLLLRRRSPLSAGSRSAPDRPRG